jgi:phospholipid/cholesterol/gamma-HCH transport system substrate-binding protein
MMRRPAAVAAAAVIAAALAGCGFDLQQLPSTGGVGGPTYRVTAEFTDVSALTVGAKVKLQGVVIGEVGDITTANFHADVAMTVQRKFSLPTGTTFQIRFTTPLGEDYVAVAPPEHPGSGTLADGARVPVAQTGAAPSIEDTFAALSLLLNGGGLDKLQTIARELGTALRGRTGSARDTLEKLHTVVADLDAHKGAIDRALDGLAALSTQLARSDPVIEQALAQFPDTIRLLAGDIPPIRTLLGKVARLGGSVTQLLARSQDAMLADFDALRPTLDALAAARDDLIPTFDSLIRFGQLFDRATPGDYLNLGVVVQLLYNAPPQHPGAAPATTTPAGSGRAAITTLLSGGGG